MCIERVILFASAHKEKGIMWKVSSVIKQKVSSTVNIGSKSIFIELTVELTIFLFEV